MLITSLFNKRKISYFILRTSDLLPLPLPSFSRHRRDGDLRETKTWSTSPGYYFIKVKKR